MAREVSSFVTIDVSSDWDTCYFIFCICTSHVFISYIVSSTWKFLGMKENLKILLIWRYVQYYIIKCNIRETCMRHSVAVQLTALYCKFSDVPCEQGEEMMSVVISG